MYLVKFNPIVVLAVEWKGDNEEEVYNLVGKANCSVDGNGYLKIANYDDVPVPIGNFIINYHGTFIVLNSSQFYALFTNYLSENDRLDSTEY